MADDGIRRFASHALGATGRPQPDLHGPGIVDGIGNVRVGGMAAYGLRRGIHDSDETYTTRLALISSAAIMRWTTASRLRQGRSREK